MNFVSKPLKSVLFALLISISLPVSGFGKDAVIVYGQNFAFSMVEPKGWHCDCGGGKDLASIQANAALWKVGQNFQNANPIIYIRVNGRGLGAAADMEADTTSTKTRVPGVEFKSFQHKMKNGDSVSKIFSYKNGKTEYVTYYYPAVSDAGSLSITMHLDDRSATKEEIAAYKEILGSIAWLPVKPKTK